MITTQFRLFETRAVDYILKPLRRERVLKAVEHLRDRSAEAQGQALRRILKHVPIPMKIAAHKGRKTSWFRLAKYFGLRLRIVLFFSTQPRTG
jgi:DNA-binding LytR/AlgR family response regulator